MKRIILLSSILSTTIACQQPKKELVIASLKATDLQDTLVFRMINDQVKQVSVNKSAVKSVNASDLIADFKYIPVETADSSLLGQYKNAYILRDRIVIEDIETNMAYIFDMKGKYINKIGRKGYGPGELFKMSSLAVDAYTNNVVLYDSFIKKMFYFSLAGDFLYDREMALNSNQNFCFVSPNLLAFAINKTIENSQLKELERYNIIYTDSMLNVLGGTYPTVKNSPPEYSPYSYSFNRQLVAYTAPFSPDFYQFSGDTLIHKYHFDYKGFDKLFIDNSADSDKIGDDDISVFYSTRMLPPVLFTNRFLWFKTQTPQPSDEFYTLYDKTSEKSLSFRPLDLNYNIPFRFTSVLTTYDDYMVGYVPASVLMEMKTAYDRAGEALDSEIAEMISGLQPDDNDILVFFKPRALQ